MPEEIDPQNSQGGGAENANRDEGAMVDAVRGYFSEYPHAVETLLGIADWWLPRHQIRVDLRRLQGALNQMVSSGELEAFGSPRNLYYRLKGAASQITNPSLAEKSSPAPNGTDIISYATQLAGAPPYASSLEHLSDELRALDLRLSLRMAGGRIHRSHNVDSLRGVVLTQTDMVALLTERRNPLEETSAGPRRESDVVRLDNALVDLRRQIAARKLASEIASIPLSLVSLSRLFDLDVLSEFVIVACLAPELDQKYDKLYAYLHDDVNRRRPSVDFILDLFASVPREKLAGRRVFYPREPLVRYSLVRFAEGLADLPSFVNRSLQLDDRIVDYLLGAQHVDSRIEPYVRLSRLTQSPEGSDPPPSFYANELRAIQYWNEPPRQGTEPIIFYLYGPPGSGKTDWANAASGRADLPLLVCDLAAMEQSSDNFEHLMLLCVREALLQHAAIAFQGMDALQTSDDRHRQRLANLIDLVRARNGLTFLIGTEPWLPGPRLGDAVFSTVRFDIPDGAERLKIWNESLRDIPRSPDVKLDEMAGKYALTEGQIRLAARAATNAVLPRLPTPSPVTNSDLDAAARNQLNPQFGGLATRIIPSRKWDDLVVPDDTRRYLEDIQQRALLRHQVLDEWEYGKKLSRGKGLAVLFSGPPGTGKTLAAEIIAGELGQDLYRVDLSQVVNKYIGETEKNLRKIFQQHALLFFDEADALYSRRSQNINDAHDKYANLEVAFLLQQIEEYEGTVFLATNLRQNIDEAFLRRIHCVVDFEFPNQTSRLQIWQKVLPENLRAPDVDLGLCAREIKRTGAEITNIALASSYLAAAHKRKVQMADVFLAAEREYQKSGQIWAPSPQMRLLSA
jgi:SpoVK/Ycf46/Vps4 family AAA+-type ATPase